MIGRWYSQLSAYDLDITYVSGKTQVTADPLSRLLKARLTTIPAPTDPNGQATAQALALQSERMGNNAWRGVSDVQGCWVQAIPTGLQDLSESRWKDIQDMVIKQVNDSKLARTLPRGVWASHQRNDQVLGPIFNYLTATGVAVHEAPSQLRAVSQSYQVRGGVLHYRSPKHLGVQPLNDGWVVAVPKSLQLRVVAECHGDGMRGLMKTVYAIRQRYFFRKLRSVVTDYVNKCEACIRAKSFVDARDLPLEPMIVTKPFAAISVDLYSPGEVLEGGWKYPDCRRPVYSVGAIRASSDQTTSGGHAVVVQNLVPLPRGTGIRAVGQGQGAHGGDGNSVFTDGDKTNSHHAIPPSNERVV